MHFDKHVPALVALTLLGGCAIPTNAAGGSNPATAVTITPTLKAAVQDLQQLSALDQLSRLQGGGSGVAASNLKASAAFRITAVATTSILQADLDSFNANAHWDSSNGHWSFVADQGWREDSPNGKGTFVGHVVAKDNGGATLESSAMEMDWLRGASTGTNDWSGTDYMTEWVLQSAVRQAGTYQRTRETVRTSQGLGYHDVATESLHFVPADGGTAIDTAAVRDDLRGVNGADVENRIISGNLPGGVAFRTSATNEQSASVFRMAVDALVTLEDHRQVAARLSLSGDPDANTHGPATIAAGSTLAVTLLNPQGAKLVALLADQLTIDRASQTVHTVGAIRDGQGAQVATFDGTFDITHDTWRGVATYADATTENLNLDALAGAISN